MKNTYNLKRFTIAESVRGFCTLGERDFTADLKITARDPEEIPDYLAVDKLVAAHNDEATILEEVAHKIATEVQHMTGGFVEVVLTCTDAAHAPVEIVVEVG